MKIEVKDKKANPLFKDLKVGETFFLVGSDYDYLFLKTTPHPNTSNNCVDLTNSKLCVCSLNSPVNAVKVKVVNV